MLLTILYGIAKWICKHKKTPSQWMAFAQRATLTGGKPDHCVIFTVGADYAKRLCHFTAIGAEELKFFG